MMVGKGPDRDPRGEDMSIISNSRDHAKYDRINLLNIWLQVSDFIKILLRA